MGERTPPWGTTVGERIAYARFLSGESARELDSLMGVTQGRGADIESGRRKTVSLDVAGEYSSLLGVRLEWLATGEGAPPERDDVREALKRARAFLSGATSLAKAKA